MRFKLVLLTMAISLMAFSVSLEAQERGRRGGGRGFAGQQQRVSRTALVQVEAVQTELDLTDEQKTSLGELRGNRRGQGADRARGQGRGADRGEGGDAQRGGRGRGGERGQQGGQGRGGQRAARGGQNLERVQAEIDSLVEILLPNQMSRLTEIYVQIQGPNAINDPVIAKQLDVTDEQREEIREVRGSMREQMTELRDLEDREQMREKMSEITSKINQEIMDVLTEGQKTKLDEMKGNAFDMPEDALRPNRGRRGRGGNDF